MNSENKKFTLMSVEYLSELLDRNNLKVERMLVRERFAINLDLNARNATSGIMSLLKRPYYINDNRVIRVLTGRIKLEVNLTDYEIVEGDIVILRDGSTLEVKELSDDASAEVLVFIPDKYPTNLSLKSKSLIFAHPKKEEWDEINHLFYTIYSFARHEPYRTEVVEPLIQALVNYIIELGCGNAKSLYKSSTSAIFDKFISELNRNKNGKYPVTYYADKLCITPQYLSRVVSQISGETASYWINKAVITQARILLRNTSNTISYIAESLNFPNDSFFCRFFKKNTGLTPTEYRKSAQ